MGGSPLVGGVHGGFSIDELVKQEHIDYRVDRVWLQLDPIRNFDVNMRGPYYVCKSFL